MGVDGQLLAPGYGPVLIAQEAGWAPGTVWAGAESLAPTGFRSPDRPARRESLYQLIMLLVLFFIYISMQLKSLIAVFFNVLTTESLFLTITAHIHFKATSSDLLVKVIVQPWASKRIRQLDNW